MPSGIVRYEILKDGKLMISASSILEARQAFLEGDLEPLLELVVESSRPADPEKHVFYENVILSPHLARLLIEVLTGTIKRPNRRPRKIRMSHNDVVEIGSLVEAYMDRRYPGWIKKIDALDRVAEFFEIKKTRVKQAYDEYQKLKREPRPWDQEPTTNGSSRKKRVPPKK